MEENAESTNAPKRNKYKKNFRIQNWPGYGCKLPWAKAYRSIDSTTRFKKALNVLTN